MTLHNLKWADSIIGKDDREDKVIFELILNITTEINEKKNDYEQKKVPMTPKAKTVNLDEFYDEESEDKSSSAYETDEDE